MLGPTGQVIAAVAQGPAIVGFDWLDGSYKLFPPKETFLDARVDWMTTVAASTFGKRYSLTV